MSFLTGTCTELLYASTAATAAKASFNTEFHINPGSSAMGVQARIPVDFWLPNNNQTAKAIRITCRGILSSNTVSPSYTWRIRGGAVGTAGPILLATAALGINTSMSNVAWNFEGDIIVSTMAAGAFSTVQGFGFSPTMWSNNFTSNVAALTGTATTLNTSITNYINVTVQSSTLAAANSITLQQLLVWGLN